MKGGLVGLLLGVVFATLPLKGLGQEEKKEQDYNINWMGFHLGTVKCGGDTAIFKMGEFQNLSFYRTDSTYQEVSIFKEGEEKYSYIKEGKNWKLEDYDFIPSDNSKKKSKKRQSKEDAEGTVYSEDVLLGIDLFNALEQKIIPNKLKFLTLGEVYFAKIPKGGKVMKDSLVRASYDLPGMREYKTDRVRVKEPVKVGFRLNKDGKYSILNSNVKVQYKLPFFGWTNVNVYVKRINNKK